MITRANSKSSNFFFFFCAILLLTIEYTVCTRKHFREQEAEKWWAENRARLYVKHDIHGEEDFIIGSPSTKDDKNGATG